MSERPTIHIPTSIAEAIARHAIAWYPKEACGLLFAAQESVTVSRAELMDNLQDRFHERLPEDFPRTARDAFKIDERKAARMAEAAEEQGERLIAIFHSHVDCGAYFSDEDILMAAPFGEPNDPELWHVVIDGQADGVHGAKAYFWDNGAFREHALPDFPRVAHDGGAA